MKKYFLIGPIFLISLILIAFYINRNIEIAKSIDKLTDIKQLSYELERIIQKRTILLVNVDTTQKHDEIVTINTNLLNRLTYYSQTMKPVWMIRSQNL